MESVLNKYLSYFHSLTLNVDFCDLKCQFSDLKCGFSQQKTVCWDSGIVGCAITQRTLQHWALTPTQGPGARAKPRPPIPKMLSRTTSAKAPNRPLFEAATLLKMLSRTTKHHQSAKTQKPKFRLSAASTPLLASFDRANEFFVLLRITGRPVALLTWPVAEES